MINNKANILKGILSVIVHIVIVTGLMAQTTEWSTKFSTAGVDDHVHVMASDDRYVCMAGSFRHVGGIRVASGGSACYDTRANTWEVLPVSGWIRAIAFDHTGNLFIGGENLRLNGNETGFLLKRNASGSWIEIKDYITHSIDAISASPSGSVFAASSRHVYEYNVAENSVTTIATIDPESLSSYIADLSVSHDGSLYVGGKFRFITYDDNKTIEAQNVAQYVPSTNTWASLGGGLYRRLVDSVNGIGFRQDGSVIIGGGFSGAIQSSGDTLSVGGIVQWDPALQQWTVFGDKNFFWISEIEISESDVVYVVDAENVWRSKGNEWILTGADVIQAPTNPWAPLESARSANVLAAVGSEIYIGLMWRVRSANAFPNSLLYVWVEGADIEGGSAHIPDVSDRITLGLDGGVASAVFDFDERLYVGGTYAFAGSARAGIAVLENDEWTNLGLPNGPVRALALSDDGSLFAAGFFSQIKDPSGLSHDAANIARMDSHSGIWDNLDGGADGNVHTIATLRNGGIVIGGRFNTVGSNGLQSPAIAMYVPSDGWTTLSGHQFAVVFDIVYSHEDQHLYVVGWSAGQSDSAIGQLARYHLGREEWEILSEWPGSFALNVRFSLKADGSKVILAAVQGQGIWQYSDGTVAYLGGPAAVTSLEVSNEAIYVGDAEGYVHIYKDSAWHPVASFQGEIMSLSSSTRLLAVAGEFSALYANGETIPSANLALLHIQDGVTPPSNEPVESSPFHVDMYPSPARDAATISFYLEEVVPISIAIYDVQGRVIHLLELGEKPIGHHERVLNLIHVSSGVYFIVVQAGSRRLVRSLLVIN